VYELSTVDPKTMSAEALLEEISDLSYDAGQFGWEPDTGDRWRALKAEVIRRTR
jgi:hypothetical protein